MAEPPDRNSSTRMPVSLVNRLAIFCAASIGVDVYQTTLPSALAAWTSTASAAIAAPPGPAMPRAAITPKISLRLSIVFSLSPRRFQSGTPVTA
jgi:hypothetical protein